MNHSKVVRKAHQKREMLISVTWTRDLTIGASENHNSCGNAQYTLLNVKHFSL